jgi:hypothetical protein
VKNMDDITRELMSLANSISVLRAGLMEFERLTKARCEVIENFIGLMPKQECKCEDKNTDYHLTQCCKSETITINRAVAKVWIDEMLAQAKYARISPQSVVNLMNEIRKGLS